MQLTCGAPPEAMSERGAPEYFHDQAAWPGRNHLKQGAPPAAQVAAGALVRVGQPGELGWESWGAK